MNFKGSLDRKEVAKGLISNQRKEHPLGGQGETIEQVLPPLDQTIEKVLPPLDLYCGWNVDTEQSTEIYECWT